MNTIILDDFVENGKNEISIIFNYNEELISMARRIRATWNPSKRFWHIKKNQENINRIYSVYSSIAEIKNNLLIFSKTTTNTEIKINKTGRPLFTNDEMQLKNHLISFLQTQEFNTNMPLQQKTLQQIENTKRYMIQKRMSENTINTYTWMMKKFFEAVSPKKPEDIVESDIYQFNYKYIVLTKYSITYQNQVINAIKKFYEVNMNKNFDLENLERPMKSTKLPEILSKEEVTVLIKSINNLKHRAIISTTYALGLRIGESLSLKISDIDSDRNIVHIKNAKGNKDRIIAFPDSLRTMLRTYFKEYRPKIYLFEGINGGKYSNSSIGQVLRRTVKRTNIKKRITLHTLRHSFATHLLESGTDIRFIQEILGHNSPKTTMIYTHVSSKAITEIKSPFEDLDL
jgi:site-specific recombinase XerD